MPDEMDLNLDLNMIADLQRSEGGPQAAEAGAVPAEPPPAAQLQTLRPGQHLGAEQVNHLMGDEDAVQVGPEREESGDSDPLPES